MWSERASWPVLVLLVAPVAAGCPSSDSDDDDDVIDASADPGGAAGHDAAPTPDGPADLDAPGASDAPGAHYAVGGTVTGLRGTLVLDLNGAQTVTVLRRRCLRLPHPAARRRVL